MWPLSLFGIAVDIFVYNPIEYGCQKFFKRSMDENQSLGVMFNGFKDGYKNIVKVMFFRDLFVFLWSLLFIIPGIVKGYSAQKACALACCAASYSTLFLGASTAPLSWEKVLSLAKEAGR